MHFAPTIRTNPETGQSEAYFRLKETYRDSAGVVRSRILLSPGFIKDYAQKDLCLVAKVLTFMMDNRGNGWLWEDALRDYPSHVSTLAKEYWSLMETKGTIDVDQKKDQKRIDNERNFICGSSLEHEQGREVGAEWTCLQAIHQLGLDDFLRSQKWDEETIKVSLAHLITRTVYSPSEWKSLRVIQENSAVGELLNLDLSSFNKHDIYAVAPALYAIKDKLEAFLCQKTDGLFDLTNRIALFDLTNFYYEGRKDQSKKAAFGRSKEKRNDCKLLVLALCINTDGFIRYSSILEGNTADPASLPDMIEKLVAKNPVVSNNNEKVLVVIDAGIASEENLKFIKEKGYNYLCVSRKRLTSYELAEDSKTVIVHDCKKQEIRLTEVCRQEGQDYYLRINSPGKTLKETSMKQQFKKRFEEELFKAKNALTKKGGIKKFGKVCERVGRIMERYPSIQRFYEITYELDDKDKSRVVDIKWTITSPEEIEKDSGIYFLRTNLLTLDEKTTWSYYNLIREIECTNRQLKLDLNLRPIYHQKDDASDAHIFFGLLAYWIVNTIRYQLKQTGMNHYWTEIIRIMNTQKAVTTTAVNKLGEKVEFRMCTKPTEKANDIYKRLKYKTMPFKKMKICSTQT